MLTKLNIFNKCLLFKNFSVFSKLKKFQKSEELSNSEVYKNIRNPEEIKVELEEPRLKTGRTKLKKDSKSLTPEELEILKNLPNQTISN